MPSVVGRNENPLRGLQAGLDSEVENGDMRESAYEGRLSVSRIST